MSVLLGIRRPVVGQVLCRSAFVHIQTAFGEDAKKRITVPQKMLKVLSKRKDRDALSRGRLQPRNRSQVIINCKRPQFNHHINQTYSSFNPKELASGGWKHPKSKGDHIIINAVQSNPALLPMDSDRLTASFEAFSLPKELINGLKLQNITIPTNIQNLTIPLIQKGANLICAAETGSGKTLAFLLPMIDRIHRYNAIYGTAQAPNRPMGVILCPSRELADQIHKVASDLAVFTSFVADVKCGGRGTKKLLLSKCESVVDVLVTTPGVFSKLLTNKLYDLSRLSLIVLDEADTLLDDSFSQMTVNIIQKLKVTSERPVMDYRAVSSDQVVLNNTQLVLVGATMPRSIEEILGEVVPLDTIQTVTTKHLHRILPHITQKFVRLGPSQRPEHFLTQIKFNVERKIPTIVFCNKTATACFLGQFLNSNTVPSIVLHANMPQKVREGRYEQFQNGDSDVIVCTDIISRGLDTTRARHVINYEFPNFIADYIHRVGRVGRVGTKGSSYVLSYICFKWDVELLWQIETSARRRKEYHNVNANIKRKLVGLSEQKQAEETLNVIET